MPNPIDPGNVAGTLSASPAGPQEDFPGVPDDSQFWSPVQASQTWYPETTLDVRYDFYPGVEVAYPSGPDGAAGEVLKLRAGYWTKVVQFSYERQDAWPAIPSMKPQDDNLVLTHATVTPARPKHLGEGHFAYRISGVYVYNLLRGLDPSSYLLTATDPATPASAQDMAFPMAQMDPNALAGGYTLSTPAPPRG